MIPQSPFPGAKLPRLLQLVHGFPPAQQAGTEVYASRLAEGLRERGWTVHTLAAHRLPGAPMYQCREEPGLTRLVQNAPFRGLAHGESDRAIDRVIEAKIREFRPDILHVQHLQFLSSTFRSEAPMVWTLHDAWGWCAAGGQLLREGRPCEGPSGNCAACAGNWGREPAAVETMLGLAGRLGRWMPPERLHRAWKSLPPRLRAALPTKSTPLNEVQIQQRSRALATFARRCGALLSPSHFLAERAVQQGLPRPGVIPHGVDAPSLPESAREYILFLGTLSPHKGPLRVREAWEKAGRPAPLRIVGPPGTNLDYLRRLQEGEPAPEAAVQDPFPLLRRAKALVLGSIWPENAPLVVLEAQAVGCPVLAPDVGGLREQVPAENLYRSDAELVEKLRQVETLTLGTVGSFGEHLDRLTAVYQELITDFRGGTTHTPGFGVY